MPAPIPDLSRNQTCHHYQAPTGQRCGSPAIKGEYYCYHHHIKHARHTRVLIDPEVTRMELPPIEDRASIFVALAAIVHRLAENTIDTRRAGHMISALRNALLALQNPRPPKAPPEPEPHSSSQPHAEAQPQAQPEANAESEAESAPGPSQSLSVSGQHRPAETLTPHPNPPAPAPVSMSRQSLLYFLRSRHCANCNAELFPAHELSERRHPGASPGLLEEERSSLPAASWVPEEIAKQIAIPPPDPHPDPPPGPPPGPPPDPPPDPHPGLHPGLPGPAAPPHTDQPATPAASVLPQLHATAKRPLPRPPSCLRPLRNRAGTDVRSPYG